MNGLAVEFRQALEAVESLPPFPAVFHRILEATSDEGIARGELVRLVGLDPAIAAKVLQTVNSAYFSLPRRVSDLPVAVGLLGDGRIRELALLCAAAGLLNRPVRGYGVAARDFWLHAVGAAKASALIAERKWPERREAAFTAGLLHDIGKLAIDRLIGEAEAARFREAGRDLCPPWRALEEEAFGFSHGAVGFFIARRWNFPEELQLAIAYHHHPAPETEGLEMAALVGLADALSHMAAMGIYDLDLLVQLSEGAALPLGFSPAEAAGVLARLQEEMAGAAALEGL